MEASVTSVQDQRFITDPASNQETAPVAGEKKPKKSYHSSARYAASLSRSAMGHLKPYLHDSLPAVR